MFEMEQFHLELNLPGFRTEQPSHLHILFHPDIPSSWRQGKF